ncbi:MAG: AAA family ATPase [Treponema sp.]|uniref:AAA family ATPase n=1 Tax=Treponema sp. TaxID=166 RepID=UPI00298E497F|nr:AAA family ATPase [Treponema sp.]MDD5811843.1 AAA family ATPase [Treponema sp.]
MEMMVIKFRTNDLHSSLGKQIEFNPTVIKDFFKFTEDVENTTFVYKSNIENDPLTNTTIKVILKKSPARGDYKVYQNEDGSLFLKNFLLKNLNLSEDNIDDYLTIRKRNKTNYDFTYIKADSEIGKFFKLHNLGTDGGSIIHDDTKQFTDLNYTPCKDKIKSYNRIIFGAPGTGKSFQLKDESTKDSPFANIERVTFHPDYSYGQFVGSYKPVSDDDGRIRYEYVPGPFMRTLVKALESGKNGDSAEKFLLIVEEINREKVAAVFGDMFQLLDRTDAGDSVYEIQASEDVRRYLARELGGTKENYTSIKIPNNMYIWATMNSADQGVFPMDTAFKRRWEFTYLSINANEKKIAIEDLPIINGDAKIIKWNILRKSINNMLLKECKVNEDKLLGPFFISGEVFKNATSNTDAFFEAFNSKVLMYLFEDAGKMHQKKLFAGIDQNELTFSKVCEDFKTRGTAIFGNSFQLVKE